MANNCLKTQLKSVVDNDNLPILNCLLIDIKEISNFTNDSFISVQSNTSTIQLDIIGDGYFKSSYNGSSIGKHIDVAQGMNPTYWYSNGNYKIKVSSKYSINKMQILGFGASIDINEISYMTLMTELTDYKAYYGSSSIPASLENLTRIVTIPGARDCSIPIDLNVIKNFKGLATVNTDNSIIKGNLALLNLVDFPVLKLFAGGDQNASYLYGDIDDVSIPLTTFMPNGLGVKGTIEGFVASQRQNRETYTFNNTLRFLNHGGVTFQGQNVPNNKNLVLSWTATTITFEGVTINA